MAWVLTYSRAKPSGIERHATAVPNLGWGLLHICNIERHHGPLTLIFVSMHDTKPHLSKETKFNCNHYLPIPFSMRF